MNHEITNPRIPVCQTAVMPPILSKKRAERDARIRLALLKLQQHPYLAVRQVAREFEVSNSTLLRRYQGGKSVAESRQPFQHLTVAKEQTLVDWITRLQKLGHPPRRGYIRELAQEILFKSTSDINHSSIPIGDAWVQRFLYRHPELKTIKARTLEIARAKAITQPGIVS
jgi:hypothetical protein